MLEPIRELNRSYLAHQKEAGEDTIRDFEFLNNYLVGNMCTFNGLPMPSLLKPNFVSEKQTRLLTWAVEKISSALNKFINFYGH